MAVMAFVLVAIFFVLAIVHFHWALGGQWGFDHAVPTDLEGRRVLNPRKTDSAVVGLGLLAFGVFYLLRSGVVGSYQLPVGLVRYLGWIIPVVFLLRAMGDFKYIGFFKRVRQTDFARKDTNYFSPLCLLIGALGLAIQLLK